MLSLTHQIEIIKPVQIFNDYFSASMIILEIDSKISKNQLDSYDYYIYNFLSAISHHHDIIIGALINHRYFNKLVGTNELLFFDIVNKAILSHSYTVVSQFFPYVIFLEDAIERRQVFINKNVILSSPLMIIPYCGIFFDAKNYQIIDKLICVEDIIDDYDFFENFTGISQNDQDFLFKIKGFLGDFSSGKYRRSHIERS